MARVLLAKARRHCFEHPSFEPPLGLLLLAAVLREAGHDVQVFDMLDRADGIERFTQVATWYRPDVIGLSAITFEAEALQGLAQAAARVAPGVPVVVGGPHATAYPATCLAYPGVSHAFVGEGEDAFPELVAALTGAGGEPGAVPGVATLAPDGSLLAVPARPPRTDLDTLPLPAWDRVDISWYGRHKSMAPIGIRPYMPIVTSRGCPYGCIYCHRVHGRSYRARSPESVLAEVREIHARYGISHFEILDDNFNLQHDRALAILEGLARLPWKVSLAFPNGVRSDLLDRDTLVAMRRVNTRYLCFAIESGVPRLQKLMGKHLHLDRAREAIDQAVKLGIFSLGFFMLGFPTETLAEARQTVRFAASTPLHGALFFIVTPYAGTQLYEQWNDLIRQRATPADIEDHSYFTAGCNLSDMTDAELRAVQKEGWRRFYLDPVRALRIVRGHPDPMYLVRQNGLILLHHMLWKG